VAYLRFEEADIEYVARKLKMDERDVENLLDSMEEFSTYQDIDEVLEILVSPPTKWEDFVEELDLYDWTIAGWAEEELRRKSVYYKEEEIVVIRYTPSEIADWKGVHWIGDVPDGVIYYWETVFVKLDEIGDLYVVFSYDEKRDEYSSVWWTASKEEAIRRAKIIEKEESKKARVDLKVVEEALDTLWVIFTDIGQREGYIKRKDGIKGGWEFTRELTADEMNSWEERAWWEFTSKFGWFYKLNAEEEEKLWELFMERIADEIEI
jgi:hypothetical protein